jgi:hypothetical protein
MNKTIPVIGLQADELKWAKLLIHLLRHPDPSIPELARQALLYVSAVAEECGTPPSGRIGQAG